MTDWNYLKPRALIVPRHTIIDLAVRLTHAVSGNIVEFGVAEGESTRAIRDSVLRVEQEQPGHIRKKIFACDSFKGLPEMFEKLEVGAFACPRPSIEGVEIVEGYFEESLTPALAERVGRVSFASLDADLYSSTRCALRWLTPLLQTGSLLMFDEFLGERESEKRAFMDWSRETGTESIQIAQFFRNPSGYGSRLDQRVLYQVVGPSELQKRPLGE